MSQINSGQLKQCPIEIVRHIHDAEECKEILLHYIEDYKNTKEPIYAEGMSIALLDDEKFKKMVEEKATKEKIEFKILLYNWKDNKEHIKMMKSWNVEVFDLEMNEVDMSHILKLKMLWDDYMCTKSFLIFLYPHDYKPKEHKHIGFVCDLNLISKENYDDRKKLEGCLLKIYNRCQEAFDFVKKCKNQNKKITPPIKINDFIEKEINDCYFHINKKFLCDKKFKDKFFVITQGTHFKTQKGEKYFDTFEEVIELVRDTKKDSEYEYSNNILWRVEK